MSSGWAKRGGEGPKINSKSGAWSWFKGSVTYVMVAENWNWFELSYSNI